MHIFTGTIHMYPCTHEYISTHKKKKNEYFGNLICLRSIRHLCYETGNGDEGVAVS